jgi:nitrogen fixation protein FixH
MQLGGRGWWYPLILLGFLGVVILVNVFMAFLADATFDGEVTKHPYERGIDYNRNLAMARAQARMDWTVAERVVPLPAAAGSADRLARVTISYRNAAGRPVPGLDVTAIFSRPTADYDRRATLTMAADGTYSRVVALPLEGEWDMDVVAIGKPGMYQLHRRFLLP